MPFQRRVPPHDDPEGRALQGRALPVRALHGRARLEGRLDEIAGKSDRVPVSIAGDVSPLSDVRFVRESDVALNAVLDGIIRSGILGGLLDMSDRDVSSMRDRIRETLLNTRLADLPIIPAPTSAEPPPGWGLSEDDWYPCREGGWYAGGTFPLELAMSGIISTVVRNSTMGVLRRVLEVENANLGWRYSLWRRDEPVRPIPDPLDE